MTDRRAFAAAALAVAVLLGAAAAQAAAPYDLIGDCLSRARMAEQDGGLDNRRACIFRWAETCQSSPRGASTQGQAACFDTEAAAWDRRLNEAYGRLRAKASKDLFRAIQDHQRTWLAYRDQMCQRFFATPDAGSMAVPASRACLLKETAWRALTLDDMVEDLSQD